MNFYEIRYFLKDHNLYESSSLNKNINFSYVTYNSTSVKSNTLFICKGNNFKDIYLKEAKRNGATCYISEKIYDINLDYILVSDIRKAMALLGKLYYKTIITNSLIGITGTKGKTTTVYFLKNILGIYFDTKIPYISTIDYYTGKTYNISSNTTPESLELHKYIKESVDSLKPYFVMEISSQAEKLNRIYNMNFDIGAITNLGTDHISSLEHSSYEDYRNCKIGFLKKCKKVYIYKGIKDYCKIIKELKNKKIITYGTNNSDYTLSNMKQVKDGILFKVNDEEYKIKMNGKFNTLNACLAIAICKDLNIPYKIIKKGVEDTLVPGRMEYISNFICPIIIDFAHNKLSLETLIKDATNTFLYDKVILVGGVPGGTSLNRKKDLNDVLKTFKPYIYLTSDNPNFEKFYDIVKEVTNNLEKNSYEIIKNRKKAIKKALKKANKNNIILIFGKGNENYQIIRGKKNYYETDKKIVEKYINKKIK